MACSQSWSDQQSSLCQGNQWKHHDGYKRCQLLTSFGKQPDKQLDHHTLADSQMHPTPPQLLYTLAQEAARRPIMTLLWHHANDG